MYRPLHVHEAGHAAVAHLGFGWRVGRVHCSARGHKGVCFAKPPAVPAFKPHPVVHHYTQHPKLFAAHADHWANRRALEDAVILLSGIEAEKMGFGLSTEGDDDRKRYTRILADHFGPGMTSWPKVERLAADLVFEHRDAIKALARELDRRGDLDGRQVRELLDRYRTPVELSDARAVQQAERVAVRRKRRREAMGDDTEDITPFPEWQGGYECPVPRRIARKARRDLVIQDHIHGRPLF